VRQEAPPAQATTPLDSYLAASGGRRGGWRVFLGMVVVVACWLLGTAAVIALPMAADVLGGATRGEALAALRDRLSGGGPASVALMLATFWGIWAGLGMALPLLHGRRFATLLSAEGRARPREFWRGLALAAAVYVLSMALAVAAGGLPERSALPFGIWFVWLAPLCLLVFVQASAEELLFRGYLFQELGRRLRHPIAWAVIPSAIFGALHYNPALPGATGLLYVAVTFTFGLAAALLVARTGGVSAAMGLHTGMNVFGLTLVGMEGTISGSQLFLYAKAEAEALFYADLALTVGLLAYLLSPWSAFPRRPGEAPGT
jgi:hypothetical protein